MGLLSRLVVKCVRSTTSLAVTMYLALGQVILLLVVSSLADGASNPFGEIFKVSSTGAAARIQAEKMGDYVRTSRKQHGHPVYKKTEGVKNFLYVSPNGYWTVGRTEGSTTSGLYNPQLPAPSTPPTSGWRYSDLPSGWKEDATLKVERKTASPAAPPARSLTVSSIGPAATAQSASMGVYLLTDRTFNKFPVYEKAGGGQFLFVSDASYWGIS